MVFNTIICTQVRVWQALAVLAVFVHSPPSRVESALRGVVACMCAFDPPSVKQFQEAAAASLLIKQVCGVLVGEQPAASLLV